MGVAVVALHSKEDADYVLEAGWDKMIWDCETGWSEKIWYMTKPLEVEMSRSSIHMIYSKDLKNNGQLAWDIHGYTSFITIIQFVSFLGRCFWALCLWEKCFNIVAGLEWSVHEESLHRGLSPCRGGDVRRFWRRLEVSSHLVCFTSLYYILLWLSMFDWLVWTLIQPIIFA